MNCKKGIYQHYKGNFYEVLDVARHTETLETLVMYRALYGEKALWVRPIDMFLEQVQVNAKTVPRFRYISEIVC